jgi:branched-chain amino acid transport system ATP-binding protein
MAIDEPSLGLSPLLKTELFKKICEINQKGIGVLLVEQSIVETTGVAERIYLLEDGRIALEGNQEEVFNNNHVKEVFLGV